MDKTNRQTTHIFAVFFPFLSSTLSTSTNTHLTLSDSGTHHRIIHILRLKLNEQCILFDETLHVVVALSAIKKTELTFLIITRQKNIPLLPQITLLLPLLKREALEEAVYGAVETGASAIQLIITDHSEKNSRSEQVTRLKKIAIAASEQAKQFVIPTILPAQELKTVLAAIDEQLILFEPNGSSFTESLIQSMKQQKKLTALIGPEAGFTPRELKLIAEKSFTIVQLTHTILRARTAALLSIGLLRTLIQEK